MKKSGYQSLYTDYSDEVRPVTSHFNPVTMQTGVPCPDWKNQHLMSRTTFGLEPPTAQLTKGNLYSSGPGYLDVNSKEIPKGTNLKSLYREDHNDFVIEQTPVNTVEHFNLLGLKKKVQTLR